MRRQMIFLGDDMPRLPRPAALAYAERDGEISQAIAIRNAQRVAHLLETERAELPRYGTKEARQAFPERSTCSEISGSVRDEVAAIVAQHDLIQSWLAE